MAKSPAAILFDTDGVEKATTENPVIDGGSLQSGSYPDPSSIDTGEPTPKFIDAYGNLMTRGPVFTDEVSFRTDFGGDALLTVITGTVSVTNGDTLVTGSGTAFTTEVFTGQYVRLQAHANSVLAQVDWVEDDETLHLVDGYTGATGSGAAVVGDFGIDITGSAAYAVDSSLVELTTTTASGDAIYLCRSGDYLPFVLTVHAQVSQRIANQMARIGFADDPQDPAACAGFVFSGTNDDKVICRTSFDADSVEETEVRYPGNFRSDDLLEYQIEVLPNAVAFIIAGVRVATHNNHIPGPYTPLSICACLTNTAAVGSATSFYIDSLFFQNTDQVQTGNIFKGEPQAVQGVTDGVPVIVQFGNPGGGTALPKMVNLVYDKSDGAIVANLWKRVLTYTTPTGFNGYLIKFTSFQAEAASSRVIARTVMGTFNDNTQVWASLYNYTSPQWTGLLQAEVTTAFASGSGNVTITVTYTNESGVGGRTGTFTIPKGSLVGTRWEFTPQSGDLGVTSIENVTGSPTQVGAINLVGVINLSLHQDLSTSTQAETLYAPGATTFPPETVIGVDYKGGTVSKQRTFDVLLQLVPT